MEPKLVYIIDDDMSVRDALDDLLASVDIETRSFDSIESFLQSEKNPILSCLILDVRMPGQSGMDFQHKMQKNGLDIPVIFISGHGDIPMSVTAIKRGAIDFLSKPFREQDILEAIYRGFEVSREKIKQHEERNHVEKIYNSLNAGEKAVVSFLIKGHLNKQIAAELNVSEITVKVRRANIMQKMQVKSFADLIRMGIEIEKMLLEGSLQI
ncbi:response regulator transcription factor [Commensalibacter papalotli (ex Servin-Garciduenas et al. 2014)]|uniref:Two component LuxR family transcriptional regulator n=1 Tax=Commensalibacter papalotli (ex Servin-Garciduenas et al. 2014) TaxID=1208583 RepID=W7DRN8_9PROT|nr:response regulator [Commensalibacter papalotli (ex Servin-Garciduenas et al. 2014)]EUK17570.1 two component LuxR family transcriptional regulator [Commensalibacter papalotli (ex Servin-Garciduenas et al. 2014)]